MKPTLLLLCLLWNTLVWGADFPPFTSKQPITYSIHYSTDSLVTIQNIGVTTNEFGEQRLLQQRVTNIFYHPYMRLVLPKGFILQGSKDLRNWSRIGSTIEFRTTKTNFAYTEINVATQSTLNSGNERMYYRLVR